MLGGREEGKEGGDEKGGEEERLPLDATLLVGENCAP